MPADALEERSKKLESIRSRLRDQLDKCDKMARRTHFVITQETEIHLSPSEENAMFRHIDASHGDIFLLDVTFTVLRRGRRRIETTRIDVNVVRRQRARRRSSP